MKKFILIALVATITACGSGQNFNGKYHDVYGLLDKDELRDSCIIYSPIVPNVLLSVLFHPTIVVPVWLVGWRLWEPVGIKEECRAK